MNTQVFIQASRILIKTCLILGVFSTVNADWKVDVSHQAKDMKGQVFGPLSEEPVTSLLPQGVSPFSVYKHQNPLQGEVNEVVLLQTAEGFLPKELHLKAGQKYKISVVNVNEANKNLSFVFEKFGQFHGTYFGKVLSFEIETEQEGNFSFLCPETNQQGKVVVFRQRDLTPEFKPPAPSYTADTLSDRDRTLTWEDSMVAPTAISLQAKPEMPTELPTELPAAIPARRRAVMPQRAPVQPQISRSISSVTGENENSKPDAAKLPLKKNKNKSSRPLKQDSTNAQDPHPDSHTDSHSEVENHE